MIRSAKRSFGNKIIQSDLKFSKLFDKNPLRRFVFLKKEKQNCLRETTRLVGGANLNIEEEEEPQQHDYSPLSSPSNTTPDATQRSKRNLGHILPKSKSIFVSEESEEALGKKFQRTLALLQKISSQAGPSIITVLSLFGYNGEKDEISLVTLYTLALLGASCGFHLFLHFITLGYALGVTLPLAVALLFYQVRLCYAYERSRAFTDGCQGEEYILIPFNKLTMMIPPSLPNFLS